MSFAPKFNTTIILKSYPCPVEEQFSQAYSGLLKRQTALKRAKQKGLKGLVKIVWNEKGWETEETVRID
jgi:hypothetical protein